MDTKVLSPSEWEALTTEELADELARGAIVVAGATVSVMSACMERASILPSDRDAVVAVASAAVKVGLATQPIVNSMCAGMDVLEGRLEAASDSVCPSCDIGLEHSGGQPDGIRAALAAIIMWEDDVRPAVTEFALEGIGVVVGGSR